MMLLSLRHTVGKLAKKQIISLSQFITPLSSNLKFSHMSDSDTIYKPPAKVEELFAATDGNKFASINAPTAGAREEKG